jgi:hypothetical protein
VNPDRAVMIAKDLMKLHVPDVTLRIDRSIATVGHANRYAITLSYKWLLKITSDIALIDLVLHEIGHVFCPVRGHGKEWAYIVAMIGGNPHTQFDEERYVREAAHATRKAR